MIQISLNIPKSHHARARALAKREGISLEEFVTFALAEKMSVLDAGEYFTARAKGASRKKYEAVLRKVRARRPMKGDVVLRWGRARAK